MASGKPKRYAQSVAIFKLVINAIVVSFDTLSSVYNSCMSGADPKGMGCFFEMPEFLAIFQCEGLGDGRSVVS
jgi:hypothetical protein